MGIVAIAWSIAPGADASDTVNKHTSPPPVSSDLRSDNKRILNSLQVVSLLLENIAQSI